MSYLEIGALTRFHSLLSSLKRHVSVNEPAPGIYEVSDTKQSKPAVLVSSLLHGNEPGGLYAMNLFLERWLEERKERPSIILLLGNLEAFQRGVRFLEKDLNRCFGSRSIETKEEKRARQIEEFISMVPFTLDLHQTQQESESDFFIYPATKYNVSFASSLSNDTPHILHGSQFSQDGETLDTYLTLKGRTAITYEMGSIGYDHSQSEKTVRIIESALDFVANSPNEISGKKQFFTWSKIIENSGDIRLVDGLRNFTRIYKGDILAIQNGDEICSQHDGYALFPKYGDAASQSAEIIRIISNIPSHDLDSIKRIENLESASII